jgi:ribose 5-phosphate isomerase B
MGPAGSGRRRPTILARSQMEVGSSAIGAAPGDLTPTQHRPPSRGPTSWNNRSVTQRVLPTEAEIRALVRRAVSRVMGAEDKAAPAAEPGQGSVTPVALPPSGKPPIAIGADHGGFKLKEFLAFRLREKGYPVTDCGTGSTESVDYPDFAVRVAELVASGECPCGIVVDGAGIGSSMVANKVPGVRAALCYDLSSARNSREHNHANVLTLGAGLIGQDLAWQIVELWLDTPWGAGRHAARVGKIGEIERRYLAAPSRVAS